MGDRRGAHLPSSSTGPQQTDPRPGLLSGAQSPDANMGGAPTLGNAAAADNAATAGGRGATQPNAATRPAGEVARPRSEPPPYTVTEALARGPDDPIFIRTNDNQRFLARDGRLDLGNAPRLDRDEDLPVRLRRAELRHFHDAWHQRDAEVLGYRDPLHLLWDVTENWTQMRAAQGGRVALVIPARANAVAIVELEPAVAQDYWRIVTVGRRGEGQLGEVLRERARLPSSNSGNRNPLHGQGDEAGNPSRYAQGLSTTTNLGGVALGFNLSAGPFTREERSIPAHTGQPIGEWNVTQVVAGGTRDTWPEGPNPQTSSPVQSASRKPARGYHEINSSISIVHHNINSQPATSGELPGATGAQAQTSIRRGPRQGDTNTNQNETVGGSWETWPQGPNPERPVPEHSITGASERSYHRNNNSISSVHHNVNERPIAVTSPGNVLLQSPGTAPRDQLAPAADATPRASHLLTTLSTQAAAAERVRPRHLCGGGGEVHRRAAGAR